MGGKLAMTVVLGYCTFANVKEQDHLFIPVLAQEIDGILEPVENAIELFPTEGTILVEKRIFPSTLKRGSFGLWQVHRRSEARPGSRYAEYKAHNHLPPPPEIINIPISSQRPEEARMFLMNGVNLPYELSGNPLIEFSNGLVVGPISAKVTDIGFYCEEEAFQYPLNAWKSKLSLAPLFLKPDSLIIPSPRIFCGYTFLPERESLYDMASFRIMIASTMRFACKTGPGTYIISRKEQDEIINRLSSIGTSEHSKHRVTKTIEHIQYCVETSDKLADLMEVVLSLPAIEWELELVRKKIVEQEGERLRDLYKETMNQLAELEQKKVDLNKEIDEIKGNIGKQQQRADEFISETEKYISSGIKNAIEENQKLLADVAVLKPFLSSGYIQRKNLRVVERKDYRILDTFDTFVDLLSKNLHGIGLISIDARKLACEIGVAVVLGQTVFIEGIMAATICNAVCITLSADSYLKYDAMPDDSGEVFAEDLIDNNPLIMIEGINRYCVNSTVLEVLNKVATRAFFNEDTIPRPIIICSMVNGPGAVPYNQVFSSYGPILNADNLLWKKRSAAILEPGKADILSLGNLMEDSGGIEEIERILESVPVDPLWRVNIMSAYKCLKPLESTHSISAFNSTLFGWVMARAKSFDSQISDLLKESVVIEDLEQRVYKSI